jgi:tetratricopeptide (TPR) repeat protein
MPEQPEHKPSSMNSTHNEVSAGASQVVQARDIHGSIHIQQPRVSSPPVPQLLPPDITHFTGRDAELGKLDALLNLDTAAQPAAVVISAIAGTAGMGKTALAIRWAHKARDHFPDGQLYVNLRGYDPGPLVAPEHALDGFLRAMNVAGENVPHGLDAMAGYYRSLLAGRRMLVVLDNAATPEQIRPLLPAAHTCMVLVTSRSRLSGLIARDGAHRITLDLLSPAEAISLLRSLIGPVRAGHEPGATAELARRCAYLPLALRIAAERVDARPQVRIADLVNDLSIEQNCLDILSTDDDETTAVRTVFSWSYRGLTPPAARVFRFLGLHPGPDISVPAAAALTGTTLTTVRRLLDMLSSVHLLEEIRPSRYRFHDLLRAYATECASDEETELEITEAMGRLSDWYLKTAHAASHAMHPNQDRMPQESVSHLTEPLTFTSRNQALLWYDEEIVNLMAITQSASHKGQHLIALNLPAAIDSFLVLRSRWADQIAAHQISIAAARHLQDQLAESRSLRVLGAAYTDSERFEEATPHLQSALKIAEATGDPWDIGASCHCLGLAYRGLSQFKDAIENFQRAHSIYREVDDQRGQGVVLGLIADTLRRQRRLEDAHNHALQAVTLLRKMRMPWEEAMALRLLGLIHHDQGQLPDAIRHLQQALATYRDLDHRYEAAKVLQELGKAQYGAGQLHKARQSWLEALAIFDELNSGYAAEVRARLNTSSDHNPPSIGDPVTYSDSSDI